MKKNEALNKLRNIFANKSDTEGKMYVYCDFIYEESQKDNSNRDWRMFAVESILNDIIKEIDKLK